jgi:lipopolysaccharide transport system ATP-binding protein
MASARNLSKAYRLGTRSNDFPTLRDLLVSTTRTLLGRSHAEQRDKNPVQQFWALRDVSFEVKAGDILGIVGPNGAGKSTILKILARIAAPTSGYVSIQGRLGALLEVGTGFHSELTGRENIFLNGAILGMKRQEIAEKLDEIVDFSGIEKFLDTPVKHYSSGMYLRLAFAVAAHIDPEILVVDEVLAVGDSAFQQKCIAKAASIAETGRTVLFVSHQMSVLQKLCTRAIYIDGGRIQADGQTNEVVNTYLGTLQARSSSELRTRSSRTGRGQMRLTSMETYGGGGVIASGQPVTFECHVDGPKRPVQCLLTILNSLGDAVTSFDSLESSAADSTGDVFAVHVDRLLLRPGRYQLDVAIVAQDRVVEDHVEAAAVFDVLPGMLDDRPVTAPAGFGHISLPHRWVIRT